MISTLKDKIKTKAQVKVLLEISLSNSWGGDCPLSQVYKQAKESALNIISQKIAGSMKDIQIIGKPEVITITRAIISIVFQLLINN